MGQMSEEVGGSIPAELAAVMAVNTSGTVRLVQELIKELAEAHARHGALLAALAVMGPDSGHAALETMQESHRAAVQRSVALVDEHLARVRLMAQHPTVRPHVAAVEPVEPVEPEPELRGSWSVATIYRGESAGQTIAWGLSEQEARELADARNAEAAGRGRTDVTFQPQAHVQPQAQAQPARLVERRLRVLQGGEGA